MTNDFAPVNWSHSKLELWQRCRTAYHLHYDLGEPGVASPAMLKGKLIHEAIERYARACYREGKRPRKSDLDAGREIAKGYPGLEADIERFVDGTRWEWGEMLGQVGEAACPVETMFSAPLPNGDLFRGRVDLLQRMAGAGSNFDPMADNADDEGFADEWWITDYKTGFSTHKGAVPTDQLLRYAWLVQQVYPAATNFLLRIECVGAPWSPNPWRVQGQLEAVCDSIMSIVTQIEQDREWEPTVSPDTCDNCNYRSACPHIGSATLEKLDAKNITEIARDTVLVDAQVDQAKAMLKAEVEASGPVSNGSGCAWGYTQKESIVCNDLRYAMDACARHEFSIMPYLNLSPAQFAKLLENAPDALKVELEDCAEAKTGLEFGCWQDDGTKAIGKGKPKAEKAPKQKPRSVASIAEGQQGETLTVEVQ